MHVALLEDDIAIQEMMRLVLQDEGYTIVIFTSAEECLCALGLEKGQEQKTISVDLLIVDLRLSRSVSGTEVIGRIRESQRLRSLPIILMTAAMHIDTNELERLQVRLLEKPFEVDNVLEIIKALIQSSSQLNVSSSFP